MRNLLINIDLFLAMIYLLIMIDRHVGAFDIALDWWQNRGKRKPNLPPRDRSQP